jgi:hypothetical protein
MFLEAQLALLSMNHNFQIKYSEVLLHTFQVSATGENGELATKGFTNYYAVFGVLSTLARIFGI